MYIQKWCGYWQKISLASLGLTIQLGHQHNRYCTNPSPEVKPLVVVHTNGIHSVQHRFCGCGYEVPKRYQLMRERWFPATQSQPATVFTFDVLDLFLEISYQAKTNAHDFCAMFENLTDGSGLNITVMPIVWFVCGIITHHLSSETLWWVSSRFSSICASPSPQARWPGKYRQWCPHYQTGRTRYRVSSMPSPRSEYASRLG